MKKMICILLAAVTGILCLNAASAETGTVSIKELPGITSPVWKQTYEAYGRTIDVDTEVYIPDVDAVPVIKARWSGPLEEPLKSELEKKYTEADRQDPKHYYKFITKNSHTRLEYNGPVLGGKTKKNNRLDAITSEDRDLIGYDPDQAYADNNPMTVREAWEILRAQVQEVFPDTELRPDTVILEGKTVWRRNKKPVYDKGWYSLCLRQCFRGIPCMASIYNAFITPQYRIDQENWRLRVGNEELANVIGSVYSEDSWTLTARLCRETGELCGDVPLLSFDAVKGKVEKLITDGYIRWINSVTLGYVTFDTDDPREYALLPCWVVWCEYLPEGPQSEKEYGINDSELLFDGNSWYYRPIIINAMTGEMAEPENVELDRIMCPDLSAWQ